MRSLNFLILAFALPSISYASNHQLDTPEKKASYSIGVDFITRMKSQDANLDLNALIHGLKDGEAGNKPVLLTALQSRPIRRLLSEQFPGFSFHKNHATP